MRLLRGFRSSAGVEPDKLPYGVKKLMVIVKLFQRGFKLFTLACLITQKHAFHTMRISMQLYKPFYQQQGGVKGVFGRLLAN